MGVAQNNLAVVGVLVVAVGGGLWLTQGDRQPMGHAAGDAVLAGPLGQIITDLDNELIEGSDCTPVLVNPDLRSLSDLNIGLDDGQVRIPYPGLDVELTYELKWPNHGLVVDSFFECVGPDGEITVKRADGAVMADPEGVSLKDSAGRNQLSPAGHGLTEVGPYFPKDGFGIIMTDVAPDTERSAGSIPTIGSEDRIDEVERPIEHTTPPRQEEL